MKFYIVRKRLISIKICVILPIRTYTFAGEGGLAVSNFQ